MADRSRQQLGSVRTAENLEDRSRIELGALLSRVGAGGSVHVGGVTGSRGSRVVTNPRSGYHVETASACQGGIL